MRARTFRSAFTLIAGGCILFALVLVDRLLYGILSEAEDADSPAAAALNSFYWIGETCTVLLLSLGLLLPRLAGRPTQDLLGLRLRMLLMEIRPIWNNVAYGQRELVLQDRQATLFLFFCRHVENQLHRRLVEIRDCEMANPQVREQLSAHDRSVIERGELALEHRKKASRP
ncbi:DUF6545 domain-containing protein [Arthrobacter sp. 2MCAF14]|uniref:DUF6545 domain-containing protein n=1 Tax=Arthrobacter sp. 2MCAF14 TaxID=3232982 RepID=UPI003F8EAA70